MFLEGEKVGKETHGEDRGWAGPSNGPPRSAPEHSAAAISFAHAPLGRSLPGYGRHKEKQEKKGETAALAFRISVSVLPVAFSLCFFVLRCRLRHRRHCDSHRSNRRALSLLRDPIRRQRLPLLFFWNFVTLMPYREKKACSCRICASKAAYVARRVRQQARARACGALSAEPDRGADNTGSTSNNDSDDGGRNGTRPPGVGCPPACVLGAPRNHVAGFVASLAHTTPALMATAPRAMVVAACIGLGKSNGPLVVEMISCVKASWVRCIAAMAPSERRRCLLWIAIKSRERECRLCLRFADVLCVRAAHAYWLDAGCATLAIVVVRRSAFLPGCAEDALTEHHGLPRIWDFMNAKGWKRKGGFTHLPQVDWVVQRNGTLVDPRGRVRDWTPIYPPPPPLLQTGAHAPIGAYQCASLPEPVGLLVSGGSLAGGLAAWIASYAPPDERERLLAPLASLSSLPTRPPSAGPRAAAPVSRVRPPKSVRPSTRPQGPKPPIQPKRAVIAHIERGDRAAPPLDTMPPVTTNITQPTATAQAVGRRLLCGSGTRCPAPSLTVHTDKRHVRAECDAGCRTRYHGACWRNGRTDRRSGSDAPAHAEPCPTPDCWGALVRVISVGGAGLVEHVVWPRDPVRDPDLGVRARPMDDADRYDALTQRDQVQAHAHDRPLARNSAVSAFVAMLAEPTQGHRILFETPSAAPLQRDRLTPPPSPTATTTAAAQTTQRGSSLPTLMARTDRVVRGGDLVIEDDDSDNGDKSNGIKDNGPPSIYDTGGGGGRKKARRVRAQKRQRVRARERATWSAVVVDGPLVVDLATDDDDLLWPEFFRP